MAETTNPVRKVHYHLRRAGALLATRQFDEALAAVDAALEIDPASLAAQAMRERIITASPAIGPLEEQTIRDTEDAFREVPVATERGRFVPTGVDAEVWLGFEQRIQERRFRGLLDQIEKALASRDGISARMALEEARELRPASEELATLADRVLLLPLRTPEPDAAASIGPRALNAVALLAVGVMLLLGLEWLRPQGQERATPPQIATNEVAVPASTIATAPPAPAPEAPAAAPMPVQNETAPTTVQNGTEHPASAKTDTVGPAFAQREESEPVATSGVRRAVSIDRPVDGGPAPATFRAVLPTIEPRVPANDGEVPDNYVAADNRRAGDPNADATAAQAFAPRQASPIAPPTPSPVPVTTVASLPRAELPARAAVAPATPVATSRGDETRVTQVLNQYARAYERLDASAARAVWPTVDERALARAFASLESQDLSFDACDVEVRGTIATASCRGKASYIGKVGNREPRTEQRQWTFELRRDGDDAWKIETAQAQRLGYR
jgi:hypothetical protein